MCHMRHVWVGFEGCGHRYVAPNTPADGEKIDCGSDNCRMSELHPNWCVNATCRERGCSTYKTQPVHYFTKRWPQKCFNCVNPGQAGGSSY